MQKQTPNIIYALSLASFAVATSAVMQVSAQEGSITDRVSIMVPSSCSMTSAVVSDHQADIVNGQYLDDIGITELNAFCNDQDGFSIYAVGYSSDEYGNNYLVDSASRANLNIPTGIATSGPSSNWAMKITLDESNLSAASIVNGFDSYSAVPSSYTQVAKRESSTDTDILAQGVKFNTSYATFISGAQAAGTYQGKVKYTLVHPHSEIPAHPIDTEGGRIAYYPNTNIYEGSMGQQVVQDTDTSITLLAPNFSRDGYGFAGWNTAYDYSGEFYGPNETITFTAGEYAEKGLSLYAVWIESEGFIQNWSGCDTLIATSYNATTGSLTAGLSSVTALTDLRDNQTYAVAKLADGKCWTIENIRLNAEATRGGDADLLSQGYAQSSQYGDFVGLADSESSYFSNSTYQNTIYGVNSEAPINIGADDYPSYRFPRYNDANTINSDNNVNNGNANIKGYGNYYTWAAAMASTKYYLSGYVSDGQETYNSNIAGTSICPSGWRLPYGAESNGNIYSGDLATLDKAMGGSGTTNSTNNISGTSMSISWRKFPNNLVYSGNMAGSTADSKGGYGYLWSTTAFDYDRTYGLSIGETYINPGVDVYNKYYGFAIRCVVEQ